MHWASSPSVSRTSSSSASSFDSGLGWGEDNAISMATGASAANQKDCPASHDLIVRERDLLKSEVVVLSSQLAESRTLYAALAEDHGRLKHQLVG